MKFTSTPTSIAEPIPLSLISGRYFLFDINIVTYLRRTHHICGVLIGSIPQIPQQNIFLGLPVQLLPEEARLLVERGVAHVVDDQAWHKRNFSTLQGEDRKRYLGLLRAEGLAAKKTAELEARKRSEVARAAKKLVSTHEESSPANETTEKADATDSLFDADAPERRVSISSSTKSTSDEPFGVTRTTSYAPQIPPQLSPAVPAPPPSYPLFKHLHSYDYFITPGLRFGCDYTVYPGDPFRFHSHFLAVGYEWNEEIPMLDLVGGGRLGTGVKKGFLIGGEDPEAEEQEENVRTFCLEWGGM